MCDAQCGEIGACTGEGDRDPKGRQPGRDPEVEADARLAEAVTGGVRDIGVQLRYRPWSELGDHEHIERMREVIKDLQRTERYQQERIHKLEQQMEHRIHTGAGIYMPMKHTDNIGMCEKAAPAPGQEWF